MKAICLLAASGFAALLALPLEAVAGETQSLKCSGGLILEMDASLVQSSGKTELEDETEITLIPDDGYNDGTKFGPYKFSASSQGEMGGTRMTIWSYKGRNLTLRLMTTSKDSEPDLYVNGNRSNCLPI